MKETHAFKLACALTLLSGSFVYANPEGFHLVAGEAAAPVSNGNTLQVTTGDKAIIHWDSFSIASGETTKFLQPSSSSAVLNRVMHGDPSALLGTLESNGKVFLINPNGILVGEGACINTASFIASTFDVMNDAFLRGDELVFAGQSNASVVNLGTIKAWDGDVLLIGYQVNNSGKIEAPGGLAALAAGREILLKPMGAERVFIRPRHDGAEPATVGVSNTGHIEALQTELKAEGNPYLFAIKHSGKVQALSRKESGGRIYLVAQQGSAQVEGELLADNREGKGGEVQILGDSIALLGSVVDASGVSGGGKILIGGDLQGANPNIPNASNLYVDENSAVRADALSEGDGGTVILWANEKNGFYGNVSARGGREGGNGGFVEISSADQLAAFGSIDTMAPQGRAGTLLYDPANVVIGTGTDSGFSYNPSTGVFTFNSASSLISTSTLTTNLGSSNVTVYTSNTSGSLGGTGTITVSAPVTWSSNYSLTLTADDTITLLALLSNSGSAGVTLQSANDLIIGGTSSSAACGVSLNSGSISATSTNGNLSLIGGGAANAYARLSTTTGNISASANNGVLTLTGGSRSSCDASIQIATSGNITTSSQGVAMSASQTLLSHSNSFVEIYTCSGNISVTTTGTSNNTCTVSGGSSSSNYARIGTDQGSTTLTLAGALSLKGGSACDGTSYASVDATSGVTIGSSLAPVGNITLQGGDCNGNYARIQTIGSAPINVYSNGDILLRGGNNGTSSDASIQTSSSGDISIVSGTLSVSGSLSYASKNSYAQVYTPSGNVSVTTIGDCAVTSGVHSTSFAKIGTAQGSVAILAGGDLNLLGGSGMAATPSQAQISGTTGVSCACAGNANLLRNSQLLTTGGDLLLAAGVNANLQLLSNLTNTGSGVINVIVDSLYPTSPSIGIGSLILVTDGTNDAIQAASGVVRIFTATREQNSIFATSGPSVVINGTAYVPGTDHVNTNTEQWGTYYPSSFSGGEGFTLFYKN